MAETSDWGQLCGGPCMTCARCGGLKIAERFYGIDGAGSAWSCDGVRCVNCGAVSFTLLNRQPFASALARLEPQEPR